MARPVPPPPQMPPPATPHALALRVTLAVRRETRGHRATTVARTWPARPHAHKQHVIQLNATAAQ